MSLDRHHRDNAGKSAWSYVKHQLMGTVMKSQGAALALKAAQAGARLVIIDMHGGDGEGVERAEPDFFDPSMSVPSPKLATNLAHWLKSQRNVECDVIICERTREKLVTLQAKYPTAHVVQSHKKMLDLVKKWRPHYAIVMNDPCGPSDQAVDVLAQLSKLILYADFIIVMNETGVQRLAGMRESSSTDDFRPNALQLKAARAARNKYNDYLNPRYWFDILDRRALSRTGLISSSRAFNFRVMVVSNFLADAAKRRPFQMWEPQ